LLRPSEKNSGEGRRGPWGGPENQNPTNQKMQTDNRPLEQIDNNQSCDKKQLEEYENQRKLLHELTQETRFNIIQTILMHPEQQPSLSEIDYMHPNKSTATLREHVEKLVELGILEKLELPKEMRSRDAPNVFYGLSKEGRCLLDEVDLLDIEDTLQYIYQNMEKPEQIQRYENAPRPTVDSVDDEKEITET